MCWRAVSAVALLVGAAAGVTQVLTSGQIVIGGLFPLHEADGQMSGGAQLSCGNIKLDKGIQRMEAMLYAVDRINKDTRVLPNMSLGVQILDTCSTDTYALEQSLEFVRTQMSYDARVFRCADGSDAFSEPTKPIAAVIGAASSQVSVLVSTMLRLFKIPQISYSSTAAELSEKPRFEFFSRVVPPDDLQAKAMADLVAALDWNYVHAIADSGSYGEEGIRNFKRFAHEKGICIDGEHTILRGWQDNDFKSMITAMKRSAKARGVVMFVNEDNIVKILANLDELIATERSLYGYFSWVASDSWGKKAAPVKDFKEHAIGAITVAPTQKTHASFDDYFKALTIANKKRNVWFGEYWQASGCGGLAAGATVADCLAETNKELKQESYVPFVIDAVDVLAKALDAYVRLVCGATPFDHCNVSRTGFDGVLLQSLYRGVSFVDGRPPIIDANGDGVGHYNVYQFTEDMEYVRVGSWSDGALALNASVLREGSSVNGTQQPVVSVCSADCAADHYRRYQEKQCCWTCIKCDVRVSIMPSLTSCVECERGQLPNARLNACVPMQNETLHWLSPYALLPAAFSTVGIAWCAVVIYVFVRYNKTPVVMASGRELCYFIIAGILCSYLITFVLLQRPTALLCGVVRVGLGLFMSAIYAAILTKTSRLARVFTSEIRTAQRPRFITPKAQVVICSAIIAVQLVGSLVWLVIDRPETIVVYPERTEAVLSCKATTTYLFASLSYSMLLIALCTYYAFKTRKIPENFNETKYIGFTMYATCITWLAFAPIYFATQNNFRIQISSLCMGISLSGSVALWCFFAPKVYIVLYQPEKNTREYSKQKANISALQYTLAKQQMQFVSHLAMCHHSKAAPTKSLPCSSRQKTSTNAAVDGRICVSTANVESLRSSASTTDKFSQGTRRASPRGTSARAGHSDESASTAQRRRASSRASSARTSPQSAAAAAAAADTPTSAADATETTPFLSPAKAYAPPLAAEPSAHHNCAVQLHASDDGDWAWPARPKREAWVVSDARAEVDLILSEIINQNATFV